MEKLSDRKVGKVTLIVAAVLLFVFVATFGISYGKALGYTKCKAEITNVENREDHKIKNQPTVAQPFSEVTIQYKANDAKYVQTEYYSEPLSSFMKTGNSISILYNPENPAEYKSMVVAYILLFGMTLSVALGITGIVKMRNKSAETVVNPSSTTV